MSFEWLLSGFASFCAGLIDSVVGGGGLILVPALFATFPAAPPATLLGTNKCASVWGTLIAGAQYARRVRLHWAVLAPAAGCALAGGLTGAWVVTAVDPAFMRRLLPVALSAVLAYTLWNRDFGSSHAPRYSTKAERAVACAIGAGVGFYDGFFGPGTGSFFIFLIVRLLHYDFLHASASAKVLNVATNSAALLLFAAKGHVWWQIGLTMAVANVAGSIVGTRLALRHGSVFVRRFFIAVVGALIIKTACDALAT